MTAPPFSDATVAYRWRCHACGVVCQETHRVRAGEELIRPAPPDGWRLVTELGPVWVCPHHEVQTLIDGKRFQL